METIQAIILGIVQGLTEFLPVSSSGHLQLAKELLGVDPEVGGLTFDLTLHAATVLSTIVVLWSEIKRLVVGLFSKRFNAEQAYVLKIILSMIPVVIVGFTLEPFLQSLVEDLPNHGILLLVGAMLLVTAILLTFAYYAKPRHKETISYRDAFIIGLAQAVATLPGLSRSGTTIATGTDSGQPQGERGPILLPDGAGTDPGQDGSRPDERRTGRPKHRDRTPARRIRCCVRSRLSGLQIHDKHR